LLHQLWLWLPQPQSPVALPATRSPPSCRCPTCGRPMQWVQKLKPCRYRAPPIRPVAASDNPAVPPRSWPVAQAQPIPTA
jgi:ribosomal protein S14